MTTDVKDWYSGHWIQTFTGKQFYPLQPDAALICIEDIAHALALQARYNGHSREFYSVAQHSLIVCDNLPHELKLWGLLHDAAEAYLGDLVRPIKQNPEVRAIWKPIEERVQNAVCARFGLPLAEPALVKEMDRRCCVTEKRDVLPQAFKSEDDGLEPFEARIVTWSPGRSEFEFLMRFAELTET